MDATGLHDYNIICPYDKSHSVAKSKMQWHLVKCRKNHPCDKSKMQTCPFDATHIINKVEFLYHINNCAKRGTVVNFIQSTESSQSVGAVSMEEIINVYVPPVEENWDNDPPERTYDALAEAKKRCVSIPEIGLSKAKKKQFKQSERLRIKALEENGQIFNPAPKCKKHEIEEDIDSDSSEDTQTPLRPPRSRRAAASICSNTEYTEESLNTSRQLNATINSESIAPISTSTAIPIAQNNSQAIFQSIIAEAGIKTDRIISQSSDYSINLFNPTLNEINGNDEVNDVDLGNLHTSTAFSSSSTLNNIDSSICPLDVNSCASNNAVILNSSHSNIDEIQSRLDAVKIMEENVKKEKAKIREMVENLFPSNDNDANLNINSRCAANFSNTKDKK